MRFSFSASPVPSFIFLCSSKIPARNSCIPITALRASSCSFLLAPVISAILSNSPMYAAVEAARFFAFFSSVKPKRACNARYCAVCSYCSSAPIPINSKVLPISLLNNSPDTLANFFTPSAAVVPNIFISLELACITVLNLSNSATVNPMVCRLSIKPFMPSAPVIDILPNSLNPANNLSFSAAANSLSSAAVSAAEAPNFITPPAANTAAPATPLIPNVNGANATITPPMPINKVPNALTALAIDLVNVVTPLAPTDIPRSPLSSDLPIVIAASAAPVNADPTNFAAPAANSNPIVAAMPPPAIFINPSLALSNAPDIVENLPCMSLTAAPGLASICTVLANFSCSCCNRFCVLAPSTIAFCCWSFRSLNLVTTPPYANVP